MHTAFITATVFIFQLKAVSSLHESPYQKNYLGLSVEALPCYGLLLAAQHVAIIFIVQLGFPRGLTL